MQLTLALIYQIVVYLIVLLVAWGMLTRLLPARWKCVGLGALTWLTALPVIIGGPIAAAAVFGQTPLVAAVALSVSAGLAEETARLFYYRRSAVMRDPDNWRAALTVGAGHGGTEALVFGLQYLAGILMFWFAADLLPADMRANFTPEFFWINATARLFILVGHVGLTFLVWRTASGRGWWWYPLAIGVHILVNLAAFAAPLVWPGSDWLGWIAIMGLASAAYGLLMADWSRTRRVVATHVL